MSNLDSTSTGDTPGTTQRSPGVALFFDVIAVLLFALLARIAHNTPETVSYTHLRAHETS